MKNHKRSTPRRRRLGRVLVLYRTMRQIGIRDLARETDVSAATLSRIERGHEMDVGTMMRLWAWLLGEEEAA